MGASLRYAAAHVMDADLACLERHGTDEGPRLGAARHQWKRQPFRRVRPAHRARRAWASRPAHTSPCSATPAAAAPARRSPTTTAGSRASGTRNCRKHSTSGRGWSCRRGGSHWAAMELMGRYAAANHALIHAHIARELGVEVLLDIENHHTPRGANGTGFKMGRTPT